MIKRLTASALMTGFLVFSPSGLTLSETPLTLTSLTTTETHSFRARLPATLPEPEYSEDDIEAEVVFGRELASKILGRYPALQDDSINNYVNKVGGLLAQYSIRSELNYHFMVLDTDEINAFAAPGGYVFITKGALELVKNEAQLAAILAHEMGHIEQRHYVRAIDLRSQKGSVESGLSAILAGGGTTAAIAFNQAINEMAEILFSKGLQSKQDEFEADASSVWLLVNTGYQPSSLARYFESVDQIKTQQTEQLSNTHPPLQERIKKLQELLNQQGLADLRLATLEERLYENLK
ncbi:MAG: M48 family metalloprotease [Methyloprofundus sp.]|nr:M48 family metalloprotease [Methyloprofundus sp.]